MKIPGDFPPPDEHQVAERTRRLEEHVGPRSGSYYANYRIEGDPEAKYYPAAYAALYYEEVDGEPAFAYSLMMDPREVAFMPGPVELRQRVLSYRAPGHGVAETETLWGDPELRRITKEMLGRATRRQELPLAFILFTHERPADAVGAYIFHPPVIPTSAALDLIRTGAEAAAAQSGRHVLGEGFEPPKA